MEIEQFYELATRDKKGRFFVPNPLQRAVWESYFNSGGYPAMLVRAGTGTGKTEAVLFPALADDHTLRRILMILPSKALIEDMGRRVVKIGKTLSSNQSRGITITIDMGGSCRRYCCRNGLDEANTYHRHLFVDDVIITTIDKFLFRIFGYGEKNKSYIFPHRIFGSAVEKRPFVIFDEAHEYDRLAFSNFIKLTRTLYVKGKDICVMSATLPESFVDFLQPVDALSGDLRKHQDKFQGRSAKHPDKKINLISAGLGKPSNVETFGPIFDIPEKVSNVVAVIAKTICQHYDSARRIIGRVESVRDLHELYDALKNKNPLVYHGRMTTGQRREVIKQLIAAQENGKGFLVLATSAIESGCDLDAHLIVTQLCNPDSLVQLAGRLNRRGTMKNAELIVAGEKIPGFVCALDTKQLEHYDKTLREMNGVFKPEMLKNYFHPSAGDWMGEILFDMLWEYVYESDLTSKPLWDKGILITRSWEPSVTLCTGIDQYSRPQNSVQVGISRFATRIFRPRKDNSKKSYKDWLKKQPVREKFSINEKGQWHGDIYRAFYNPGNPEESRWKLVPLQGNFVSCYEASLVCVIKPEFKGDYFDEIFGYMNIPKLFWVGYKDGFRQYLDYRPEFKEDDCLSFSSQSASPKHTARVWFLNKMED